jgi:ferritin-like metal-binding protein YciE
MRRSYRTIISDLSTNTVSLQNLSDLFLYELWTLCDAKKQVIAVLLRMSRLASNYELLEELKVYTDQAKGHMYLIRTIISSYQAIPPVKNCAAMKGLIASSELLFNNCGAANAGALDAALICTSLDNLHYELAKLERLRFYARLLSDRQTVTILNAVLDDRSRPNIVLRSSWAFASILIPFRPLNPLPFRRYARPLGRSAGSHQLTTPTKPSSLVFQFIGLGSFRSGGKPATAEFAEQMSHMPGVVRSVC